MFYLIPKSLIQSWEKQMVTLTQALTDLTNDTADLQNAIMNIVVPGITNLQAQIKGMQGNPANPPNTNASIETAAGALESMKADLVNALAPSSAPTVPTMSPLTGPAGTLVTINGSGGFGVTQDPTSVLSLGSVVLKPASWNDTSITFTTPVGTAPGTY